ncbi:MAG: hypothetical protein E7K05_06580 [Serratia marcescens]|nr:hypothetical protein [Serratia marcescens]
MQKITRFLALLGELMIEKAEDAAPQAAQPDDRDDALPPRLERGVPLADRFLFMKFPHSVFILHARSHSTHDRC